MADFSYLTKGSDRRYWTSKQGEPDVGGSQVRGRAAADEEGSRRGRGKKWGSHEVETRDLMPGKTKKPQT